MGGGGGSQEEAAANLHCALVQNGPGGAAFTDAQSRVAAQRSLLLRTVRPLFSSDSSLSTLFNRHRLEKRLCGLLAIEAININIARDSVVGLALTVAQQLKIPRLWKDAGEMRCLEDGIFAPGGTTAVVQQ